MRKIFPLLVLCGCLLFTSCKEKAIGLRFSWNGEFTHEFIKAIIEIPPENFQPDSAMPGDTTVETFEFFGVTMKEMSKIMLQFGDCWLDFGVDLCVDLNGLKVVKLYIPSDAKLNFRFRCENTLPELVHKTAELVIDSFPNNTLVYADDNKSFDFSCVYSDSFVLYEKSDSDDTDFDLSQMGKTKPDGIKVKFKGNKIIMTYQDNNTPTNMTLALEVKKEK